MGVLRVVAQRLTFILLLVMVPIVIVGAWLHQELLDTGSYLDSVAPLAGNPIVQDQIHTEIMRFLDDIAAGQFQMDPSILAAYQRDYPGARDQIAGAVATALESDQFAATWLEMNRAAHASLVAVLTGKDTRSTSARNGTVTIDLAPVIANAQANLAAEGIPALDAVTLAPGQATLTIFQSDDLVRIQRYVRWFDRGIWLFAGATLLTGIACFFLTREKSSAIKAIGLVLALGALLAWLAVQLGKFVTAGSIDDPGRRSAAEEIYDTVLDPMRQNVLVVGLIGLLALVATLLIDRVKPRKPVNLSRR